MAIFTAYQQYDTNHINELADPISKSFFVGGARATDSIGAYAIVIGNNLGLDKYGNLTGNPTEFTQYTRQGDAYFGVSSLDINIDNNSQNAGYAVGSQTLFGFQAEIAYWLRGDDLVRGSSFGDAISGFSGNDVIDGGAGDDTLSGGPGSDSILGGAGKDTALFTGKLSDYIVTVQSNGSANILDKVASRDGSDVLNQVERIKFTDYNIALDTEGAAGQSYRLYKAAFDRTPDFKGLGYWIYTMDNGSTVANVGASFVNSPEFQAMYGTNSSNDTFVSTLYQHVLHRAPDAAGLAYWNNELNTGHMNRGSVLASFSESQENHQQVASLVANGIQYQEWIS